MSSIDKRVVEMGFNNQQFESGVQTSVKSLEKLKQGLMLDESARSLSNLSAAGRSFSLSGISNGAQEVTAHLSAMSIVGMTVLSNLTNSAIEFGKKIATLVMGIDEMRSGFGSYETKVNAIKTVMSGTGETIDSVSKSINELNNYSDRTIYSFEEMTANISKFTNAGLSSKDAATAIQGISNVAALSGANSNEAARAMYNFGQALSQGSVRLMDWKSIENANMATIGFKQQLIDKAIALGTLKKGYDGLIHTVKGGELVSATKGFNESLEKQWLTTDVLTKTLADYASQETKIGMEANRAATQVKTLTQFIDTMKDSAKTSWTKTWQLIIGDLNESTRLFTEVSGIMGRITSEFADSRNEVLEAWNKSGGREVVIQGLRYAFDALLAVIDPVTEAFKNLFPAFTGADLFKLSLDFTFFTKSLIIGKDVAAKVKTIFTGLFTAFLIGKDAVTALVNVFTRLSGITKIKVNGGGILDFLVKIAEKITGFRNAANTVDYFTKVFENAWFAVDRFVQKIKDFIRQAGEFGVWFKQLSDANGLFYALGATATLVGKKIGDFFSTLKVGDDTTGLSNFLDQLINKIPGMEKLKNFAKPLFDAIGQSFTDLKGSLGDIDLSPVTSLADRVKIRFAPLGKIGEFLGPIFAKLLTFLKAKLEGARELQQKISAFFSEIFGKIGAAIADSIRKIDFKNINFSSIFDGINGGLMAALILSIHGFINKGSGVFGGITDIFKSVKGVGDSASSLLGGVSGILTGVKTSLESWQKSLKADMLLKIAGAIAILAVSLIALSMVDSIKLTVALTAITGLFADLFGSMALFEKTAGPKGGSAMAKMTVAMVAMSVSILILTGAVAIMANIEPAKLLNAMGAITALMTILTTTALVMSKNSGSMMKGTAGLIAFSISLMLLTTVVKRIGEIKTETLVQGLIGLGVMMLEISGFMALTSKSNMGPKQAIGLIGFALALYLLSAAVEKFGNIDGGAMTQGMVTVGLLLASLAAFTRTSGKATNVIATAVGMVILGKAMLIFADAIQKMGAMSWEEIGRGMAAMAGSLAAVTLAMRLMPKDMLIKSVGMTVMAGALLLLSKSLTSMGAMSWDEVARGLTTLAGSMAILVLGLNAMSGGLAGAAAILIVSGALLIFVPVLKQLGSMPIAQIVTGLLTLAGIFAVLGIAGLVLGPLTPILLALSGVLVLLGIGLLAMGGGLLLFSTALATLAISGVAGAAALVLILTSLLAVIPMIITAVVGGMILFATMIAQAAPQLGLAFTAIFLALMAVVVAITPAFLASLVTMLRALISTVVTIVPEFIVAFWTLISTIMQTIASRLPEIVQAGWDILMAFLRGIRDNIGEMVSVVGEIIVKFNTSLASQLGPIIESGFKLLVAFLDGLATAIEKNIGKIMEAGNRIAMAVISGIVKGLWNSAWQVIDAIRGIATDAIKTLMEAWGIKSPSKVFAKLASRVPEGMIKGINSFGNGVSNSVKDLGDQATAGFSGVMSRISDALNMNMDMAPTIRPIVDLTDIIAGGSQIDRLLSNKSINVTGAMANVSRINAGVGTFKNETKETSLPSQTSSVTFNQNNYSPKELSRLEIYRQTRNQLTMLKDMVGGKA